MFSGLRSDLVALSHVWLGLPGGRFQSVGGLRIAAAIKLPAATSNKLISHHGDRPSTRRLCLSLERCTWGEVSSSDVAVIYGHDTIAILRVEHDRMRAVLVKGRRFIVLLNNLNQFFLENVRTITNLLTK